MPSDEVYITGPPWKTFIFYLRTTEKAIADYKSAAQL